MTGSSHSFVFFLIQRPPPTPTLFPYTTLFRSEPQLHAQGCHRLQLVGEAIDDLEIEPPARPAVPRERLARQLEDRKSTRLNSSHANISYAVFCLKKKSNQP